MEIKDLICKNCGCNYDVDDMGTSFIIHHNNKNIESDEIKCPECGSVSYSERHFDNPWDEE